MNKPVTFLTLCSIIIAALINPQTANAVDFSSGDKQTILMELYTSEGCSSCPPADRWLSALKQDPRLWKQIIPVAFHVDYWNYLGWEDRFSKAAYSERQRRYSTRGFANTVYTPGFFKNGREWRVWFRNRDLSNTPNRVVGPLKARWQDNVLRAIFEPVNLSFDSLVLNVALLGMDITNNIKAGENDGKTLQHDFVVLAFDSFTAKLDKKQVRWKVDYAPTQNLAVVLNTSPRQALAVWITRPNDPTPIQAAGGFIP